MRHNRVFFRRPRGPFPARFVATKTQSFPEPNQVLKPDQLISTKLSQHKTEGWNVHGSTQYVKYGYMFREEKQSSLCLGTKWGSSTQLSSVSLCTRGRIHWMGSSRHVVLRPPWERSPFARWWCITINQQHINAETLVWLSWTNEIVAVGHNRAFYATWLYKNFRMSYST